MKAEKSDEPQKKKIYSNLTLLESKHGCLMSFRIKNVNDTFLFLKIYNKYILRIYDWELAMLTT